MMMKNAMRPFGATATSLRISAAISPACSATPTPAIATNVTATTANPAKLLTNDDSMNRMPSIESRLFTANVCCSITTSGTWTISPRSRSYGTTVPPN